jgi:hypothetical protein
MIVQAEELKEGSTITFLTQTGPVDLELVEVQSDDHFLSLVFRGDCDHGIVSESCTMLHGEGEMPVVLLTRIRPRRISAPGAYYQTVIS